MADIDEKLRRGLILIERSGGDADLLGAALLSIHGALEDGLHAALLQHPKLTPADREILAERNQGWLPRANLALKYGLLTREQRQRILEANDVRQGFAHGEPLHWGVPELRRYSQFVAVLCGRRALLEQIQRRRDLAARAPGIPASGSNAGADRQRDQPAMGRGRSRLTGLILAGALVLVLVAFGGVALSRPAGLAGLAEIMRLVRAPTATPIPTPSPPTPTPRIIEARLVRLGAGPGWLHDAPNFASPTLPIPLQEGHTVTVLERQQTDSSGTLWRYVSVGGYEGWCPANNLELLR